MPIANAVLFLFVYTLLYLAAAWGIQLGCKWRLKTRPAWRLCLLCPAVSLVFALIFATAGFAVLAGIRWMSNPDAGLTNVVQQAALWLPTALLGPAAYLLASAIFIRKKMRTAQGKMPGLSVALMAGVLGWLIPMVFLVVSRLLILFTFSLADTH